jgi:predicted PurR-regulated permease PerM
MATPNQASEPVTVIIEPTAALPHGAPPSKMEIAAWLLTALGLVYTLKMNLLPALLGGLLVYQLVHMLAPRIPAGWIRRDWAKPMAVAVLSVLVVALLSALVLGGVSFLRGAAGNLELLLQKMVDAFEAYRHLVPAWLGVYLPDDTATLRAEVIEWVRRNGRELQLAGAEAGRSFAYVLIGMIIGAMVSLREAVPEGVHRPFAAALLERAERLSNAFRRVVFAQVRIAAINAFFTWLYLGVALPLMGVELPLLKTLVAVTFFCGLLPVVGNLISNTVIVLVSLNHSFGVAVGSLAYLVVIHKLEYFLNARIIGSQIHTRAWELLLVMLAMEVAFGIPGVIAAPIFYAYVKSELSARALI